MIDLLRYICMTVIFIVIGYLISQMYNNNK